MSYEDSDEVKDTDVNKDEEQQEKLDCIIKKLDASRKHLGEKREQMRLCFDYVSGNQWPEQDKERLDNQGRPAVVINRVLRIVNAICGLEVQNRMEATVHPRRIETSGVADVMNDAMKWARDSCDAEDEDSEVFRDSVICGYGFSETTMEYDENPDGDIKKSRIDPTCMLYDPSATKKNLIDAKWFCHETEMTRQEIRTQFGDIDLGDVSYEEGGEYENDPIIDNPGDQYATGSSGNRRGGEKKIKVRNFQEYKVVNIYRAINPLTGQLEEIPEEQFKELQEKLLPIFPSFKGVKTPVRVYTKIFIIGKKIVSEQELKCKQFTFNCMTGFYDRNRNVYFGAVDVMIDPQMWQNKFMSQILHILNTNAKGGLIVETGTFSDPKNAEENWAKGDSIVYTVPGSLSQQRLMPKPQTPYPQGLDHLMQYAQAAVPNVIGISEEFLGQTGRDQPYVLEYQRQKQGILNLAPLFDSARRYRKTDARLLVKYIREYISDGRLIRIVGPNGAQYVRLVRDSMALDYDVVVDDAPTSPNMKERVFEVLSQLIPTALQAGIPIPPEVLDYAPLPDELTQKWKQRINQPDPIMQQLQQLKLVMGQLEAQQTQLENQKIAADVGKTMSEIPLNAAKAEQASAIGQDESAQAAQKLGIAHSELQMKQREMLNKQAIDVVDMMMTQKRKQQEMQLNAQLKAQQVQQNQQLPRQ